MPLPLQIEFANYRPHAPPDQRTMTESDEDATAYAATLAEALTGEGIELEPQQIEQLDRYRQLLWEWNEKMNLTRHTTLEKFVTRDVVDSLELSKLLEKGERVLDVGTGGGVPGVVLAITRPDLTLSLCESTGKKARAVEAMVAELGLPVTVYASRAEDVLEMTTFDTLVARAVASLAKALTWFKPHWDAFDELLLIKGPAWVEERGEARHRGLLHGLELRKAASYQTPRSGPESVILKIWRPGENDVD
jgi:16S rRNA (guanine527-N7)-methyltransferase